MNHNAHAPPQPVPPMDVQELHQIVAASASQDPSVMMAASTRLKDSLKIPGTLNELHNIAANRDVPLPVRQLCMLQCKNEMPTQWRQRKSVLPEQKDMIRQRCIVFLDEPDETIAQCNEVIVGKIARSDFPNQWSTLLSEIMTRVQYGFTEREKQLDAPNGVTALYLTRSIRVLQAVLKEFTASKMPLGANTMGQIMDHVHEPIAQQYVHAVQRVIARLDPSTIASPRTLEDMKLCRLLLKCVTIMAVWVWQNTNTARKQITQGFEPWVISAIESSVVDFQTICESRHSLAVNFAASGQGDRAVSDAVAGLSALIRTLGKFFRRLQQLSPARFVSLQATNTLVMYYWGKVVQSINDSAPTYDSPLAVYPLRFLVQGMVLFKDNLAQWSHKKDLGAPEYLDSAVVREAVTFLVTKFMPLKEKDLQEWMADPEEFVNVEDQDDIQWQFQIRPCAERVLMTFSSQFSSVTNPLLIEAFNNVNARRPTDLAAILEKEAIYTAIGRCSHRLKDDLDLVQWLDIAIAEAKEPSQDYLILKRRIAWMLGRWMIEGSLPPKDTRVWEILAVLLSDSSAQGSEVVRLTAATAIMHSVKAITVTPDAFAAYLSPIISQLLNLLESVDNFESKRKITDCLDAVIEASEQQIMPFVDLVTGPLPELWNESGREIMHKQSIVHTVQSLVIALGDQSAPLASIIVPIVQQCLSPEFTVQMDEDGMKLWLTALRATNTLEGVNGRAGLKDLFPLAINTLATNKDLLGKMSDILESYFLLGSTDLARAYAQPLLMAFREAVSDAMVVLNQKDLLDALELFFQLADVSTYAEALHTSGLFAWLLKNVCDDKMDTLMLTTHIHIFARIVVSPGGPTTFVQLIAAAAQATGTPESTLWEGVLDQWWRRFDNMHEPRYRKLSAMGMAALVSTARPEVLERLPTEIFNLWTDVFGELREELLLRADKENSESETTVMLYWDTPTTSFYKSTEDTAEYPRRKATFEHDIVRTTLLAPYVGQALEAAQQHVGVQTMQAVLAKADPAVFQSLQNDVFKGGLNA